MLPPALGLAALAFAFGALVLLGLWSFWVAILVTVLLQAWGLLTLRRAPSPSVSERDAWFRAQRAQPRMWLGGLIALLALLPVLVADTPQGVDWVGFTALAHHLAERGAFVSASGHSWLYPPGLPAMLAFLAGITGLPLPSVGLAVGQFTLVALLLGMCSALDRHGAGGEGIRNDARRGGLLQSAGQRLADRDLPRLDSVQPRRVAGGRWPSFGKAPDPLAQRRRERLPASRRGALAVALAGG